jgi:hypothetical protein
MNLVFPSTFPKGKSIVQAQTSLAVCWTPIHVRAHPWLAMDCHILVHHEHGKNRPLGPVPVLSLDPNDEWSTTMLTLGRGTCRPFVSSSFQLPRSLGDPGPLESPCPLPMLRILGPFWFSHIPSTRLRLHIMRQRPLVESFFKSPAFPYGFRQDTVVGGLIVLVSLIKSSKKP